MFKSILSSVILGLILTMLLLPLAATAAQRLPTLAGEAPPQTTEGLVRYAYIASLVVGAVLAFGILVWAGILYITSAGNPSRQQEARAWISSAVLGLLLLLGAYLILNTINPALVELRFPSLSPVSTPSSQPSTPAPTSPIPPGIPTPGQCSPPCSPAENCIDRACVPIF